jgi:NitT/TauT family transport system substrate-binding protein
MAKELLSGEGFTDAQYVKIGGELFMQAVVSGEVDIAMNFVGSLLIPVDAGDSVVMLAGGHIGCFELVGRERIRSTPYACRRRG